MNTNIEPNTVATYIIQRLSDAGSPPTSQQVQQLLYFIQALHFAKHGEPAFQGQILKTHVGIRIPAVQSAMFHLNGAPAVPVEEQRHQHTYSVPDPQVVQFELLASVEEVLAKYGGRSGWEMNQEIVAGGAWKNPGTGFGAEQPLQLDRMAAGVKLERVKVGSTK